MNEFALAANDGPKIIEAMGIATMRMPLLPEEVPADKREMIMMAGRASYFQAQRTQNVAARAALQELVNRYPDTPNVHYAYGIFLLNEEADEAIEEFERELKVSPTHHLAMLQIAFEYIKRGDYEAAKPWARKAVDVAPNAFVARKAWGQVLMETGDVEAAIAELEAGVKMAPDSPQMRFALARAYQRAGLPPTRSASASSSRSSIASAHVPVRRPVGRRGVAFAVYFYALKAGTPETARTYAFAVLVFAELLRSFGARSETKPVWRISLFTNVSLVIVVAISFGLQVWSQHNATLGRFLKTSFMPFADCFLLLALGAIPLLILEILKVVRHGRQRSSSTGRTLTQRAGLGP